MQIRQIGLGASAGDTSLLKLEYGYGAATANNGALMQQKITIPGAANQIVQSYTYDNLNRLATAAETVNSGQTWKQTFAYDRFGNRRFDANNTTTLGSCSQAICNPNIDQAKNQLSTSDGYSFDAEGNLIGNPESQLFTYDAENRLKQVQNTAAQTSANYEYDGIGKRVRKIIGNQETIFVYDAFGKLVAEYTVNQTITQNGTQYLTADALGSPRVVTSAIGGVASRHDYMPFGEEVLAGTGERTAAQGYGQTDNARQKFTSYERDDESGLDFAQNRYFSSRHGRFTSADPLAASAEIKNPQTLNSYNYGMNSPYKFVDPLGLRGSDLSCHGNSSGGGQGSALGSCESERSLDEHNQRLQNTYDVIDANRAIANGDQATAEAICGGNQGITCERSEPTITVEATVNTPDGNLGGDDAWYIPDRVKNPETLVGQKPVAEPGQKRTECVALCKIFGKLPHTSTWRAARAVFGNTTLQEGTLIATFDANGKYASSAHGNHAAIYIGQDATGIWVVEQWAGLSKIQKRHINLKPGMTDPSNNARAFSVIAVVINVPPGQGAIVY